jgi:PIN domain nuclease of toxin-antitoxin system
VRVLIDTHTFLWFVRNDISLTQTARELLEDSQVEVLISIASIWEMSIKTAIKKLTIDGGFAQVQRDLTLNSFDVLSINFDHALRQNQLPFHHRDPFDQMIAAQHWSRISISSVSILSSTTIFKARG